MKEEAPVDGTFDFSLSTKADVYFRLEDLPAQEMVDGVKQISQGHLASAIPITTWTTPYTAVVWLARWTLKGLQPSRPQVLFTKDMVLPSKKALKLS